MSEEKKKVWVKIGTTLYPYEAWRGGKHLRGDGVGEASGDLPPISMQLLALAKDYWSKRQDEKALDGLRTELSGRLNRIEETLREIWGAIQEIKLFIKGEFALARAMEAYASLMAWIDVIHVNIDDWKSGKGTDSVIQNQLIELEKDVLKYLRLAGCYHLTPTLIVLELEIAMILEGRGLRSRGATLKSLEIYQGVLGQGAVDARSRRDEWELSSEKFSYKASQIKTPQSASYVKKSQGNDETCRQLIEGHLSRARGWFVFRKVEGRDKCTRIPRGPIVEGLDMQDEYVLDPLDLELGLTLLGSKEDIDRLEELEHFGNRYLSAARSLDAQRQVASQARSEIRDSVKMIEGIEAELRKGE